ncbi:RNA polymerase factor sigma-54 [Psychrobacter sp. I-STPA10]|uniref:RNA polymerase factor sigma-54 n=1 Tax=Psychrobacter sp. I-STPA10 TaxID=2585769 RepID=UPI001E34049E|nr:RNA polymerase factor sigma-54 [Psychrobacter sp. I-STPA10]
MSISFGLSTNLSTSQKLTPQMQQAIKLLQLSSLELAQEVQIKLDNNPLLERIEEDVLDDAEHLDDLAESEAVTDFSGDGNHDDAAIGEHVADSVDKITQDSIGELEVDSDWDDVYTHGPTALASPDVQDMDDYHGATSVNLQDHVRWQLNFKHLSEIDMLIADYLVESMDESGFIRLELTELEQTLNTMASFYQWEDKVDLDQIEMVLHIIQSCEPLGVGARDLAECLQIQLRKLPDSTPYRDVAIELLRVHEYLVSNNIKALVQQTGVKIDEVGDILALIRTLNPAPGLAFTSAQPTYGNEPESYDVPDVLVNAIMDEMTGQLSSWQVRLNPDTLPKLRVNQTYANLIKRGDDSPDNVYLRDNLTDARLFIRSIEERNQNLLKVATCIVKRQQAFLQHGAMAMQPLILKDVAEEVDLHESTVSRLTTSKNILTPQGLFSLKYFFSSHVGSDDGEVSSTAISEMIKQMIAAENPKKPLSDSAIQKQLQQDGIDIARRTVAKYREAMNIGSSTQRKQKF